MTDTTFAINVCGNSKQGIHVPAEVHPPSWHYDRNCAFCRQENVFSMTPQWNAYLKPMRYIRMSTIRWRMCFCSLQLCTSAEGAAYREHQFHLIWIGCLLTRLRLTEKKGDMQAEQSSFIIWTLDVAQFVCFFSLRIGRCWWQTIFSASDSKMVGLYPIGYWTDTDTFNDWPLNDFEGKLRSEFRDQSPPITKQAFAMALR